MEIKKINWLMVGVFALHMVVSLVLYNFPDMFEIGIILNLSLGEIMLFVPMVVYLILWQLGAIKRAAEQGDVKPQNLWKRLHYNKVKPSTLLYALIFTWLSMPLTTLINAISMLFVDNTVMMLSEQILGVAFPVMLFFMAIVPAFCEETLFRGVVYGGYRKHGNKFVAVMLSGFLFGIMHMNLNQALYAFAIGVLLALLLEATNSIWPTILFHFVYNAQSCCLMYFVEELVPGFYSNPANLEAATAATDLYSMIAVYIIIAAICTPLAICMLYKIAKNEGRVEQLKETLPGKREGKARIATASFWVATVLAVGFIVYDILLSYGILA
jgi:membrane protease YdiL (CAAX protease family)